MDTSFKTLLKQALQKPVVPVTVSGQKVNQPHLSLEELLTLDGQLANLIRMERSRKNET